MMDKSSVISLVEFGKLPLNVEQSLDLPFESQPGCSRVIFRNVAGGAYSIFVLNRWEMFYICFKHVGHILFLF